MKSFYLPPKDWQEPFASAMLEGPEAHHLLKTMRAHPGDELRLFDGHGREGVFILEHHDRNKAFLKSVAVRTLPHPKREVHLALGWNKTFRRGWLLEKSVELEATGFVFWQAARSQGRVPETPKNTWLDQLVAAAKQCGNPWLPRLETAPAGARELIDKYAHFEHRIILWENQDATRFFDPAALLPNGRTVLILGPEGGLADNEVDLFTSAGFLPLSLGRSVLRWETAALLCLGLLYWQGQKNEVRQSLV